MSDGIVGAVRAAAAMAEHFAPTPSIDDFAADCDDLRAQLDCRMAEEISTNMQETVRVVDD